jgi:hypothetical protein
MPAFERSFYKALESCRQFRTEYGFAPAKERIEKIYALAKAPAEGWKSVASASNKSFLDSIEQRLVWEKAKYVRAPRRGEPVMGQGPKALAGCGAEPHRSEPHRVEPQKKLDEICQLCHRERREKSKGHIAWKMTHAGLYEYFLGPKDTLYRAPASNAIDVDTGQRAGQFEVDGMARVIAALRMREVEIPPDLLKKERKALEELVWRTIPKDYRSNFQGKKRLLVGCSPQESADGTTLKALSDFTIEELRKKAGLALLR